ncbi:hypothetical protein CN878_20575 [Ochrobactrum sp. 695/2009]|nr:hypothetical protein CN881_12835 [Ochrobactrum sp. 721/2009]PJT16641.1 hypothetical protein CN880_09900 [Ochrobactrum sp. 720/2009]PJT26463.1 hypothetical protein CN879_05865 [Ochrobactrum sp. 715/2009]PJT26847.1 hypothetical protein CN878_20575 [Ochrobactrum sp. 695/2009]PJT35983.1 hypothetical protein CN877_08310 [Ochrobactrum sp. 689/2009]
MKQLESIQFLRGIAAISVALVHSASLSGIEGSLNFLSAGVDIFFVISGIVMAISTNQNSTPFEFLWRRVTRVVPFYWIFTGLVIAYIKLRYAYIPPIDHILTSLFFCRQHLAKCLSCIPAGRSISKCSFILCWRCAYLCRTRLL